MEGKNFEETMNELEKIVDELEKGDLDLETSIKKFEDGMKLSKKCNNFLNEAEKKITILTKDSNNKIIEENFENKI